MKKIYSLNILFTITLDDGDGETKLPDKLPKQLVKSLIDNLNISDETNDMFVDGLQEHIDCDVTSFNFSVN